MAAVVTGSFPLPRAPLRAVEPRRCFFCRREEEVLVGKLILCDPDRAHAGELACPPETDGKECERRAMQRIWKGNFRT
jgi:hypothetical protein